MSGDEFTLPGLSGKVAVVTGGSRGIGAAVAEELARQGANLTLTARDGDALTGVAARLEQLGANVVTVAGDLTAPDFPTKVVKAATVVFGRVDILVNNAGATKRGDFLALTDTDWQDGFELKLFGAVRMCREFWPLLKASGGSIVNIGGAGGRTPDKPFTIGSSVNAAMMAFTKALADLGRGDGVRVNLVNPGLVRTDRLEKRIVEAMQTSHIERAAAEKQLSDAAGITHLAEAKAIAQTVAFLSSDAGKVFHGALIDADAGYTKGV